MSFFGMTKFLVIIFSIWASHVALVVKNLSANAGDARDGGSIPGPRKSSEGLATCSKQEYWSALPCTPGDLPNSGTEPRSPALQADSLLSEPPGKPMIKPYLSYKTGVGKLQQGDQIWLPSFL